MIRLTDYHAKYFAHELTRRYGSDSLEKIGEAVASAQVELNPHQVDAALFAFRSPLSKGALLADEVGLGKTIEAGLVISQRWAERKRHIDNWADDLKVALERDIKEIDRQIKEARRAATLTLTLEDKLAVQREIKALEVQRNNKRRTLFDAQDEIDQRREQLIGAIEGKLEQIIQSETLFTICWEVI